MPNDPRPVVHVSVPAKINLHLSVGARGTDGFHELRTVFHAVDLFDDIEASAAERTAITVTGDSTGVPLDEGNIAWQAIELIAGEVGVEPAVHLRIHKRIPVAGGMAGGSADAAAALMACNALWHWPVQPKRLEELAAKLGSDVTFPLYGGTAVGAGRGEVLAPVPCPPLHWVLVPASYGISAGDAYRELDRLRETDEDLPVSANSIFQVARQLTELASTKPEDGWTAATMLHNDLQPAALTLRPELSEILLSQDDLGDVARIVSGSGPTCALLYRTRAQAEDFATKLQTRFPGAVAASGPARPTVSVL